MKKRIIIKLGTSTLTAGTDKISYAKIEDLARQILELRNQFEIIIVSSGSIATARQYSGIKQHKSEVGVKQALSAIGQPQLMRIYTEVFGSFGLEVAQCLLTYIDCKNAVSIENTKNTINKLLEFGYIPIINENDTVATQEIIVGDNDKLSAYVATIVGAELLILVSDIDGIFNKNPHLHSDAELIEVVTDLEKIKDCIEERDSELGTGGMSSKIEAVKICRKEKIEVWIVNGNKINFIIDSINGKNRYTKFSVL